MKRLLVSAAIIGLAVAPLRAQGTVSTSQPQSRFSIAPYGGYMVFGDLFESEGGTLEFSAKNAPFFGVQAGVSLTPNLGLVGNLGRAKSAFTVESDPRNAPSQSTRISDDLGIFFYDASLQLRLPFSMGQTRSWVTPLAQAGVGAVKYTFDTDDLRSQGQTRVTYNVGLGADFGLTPAVALRLMAKDYITSMDWDNARTATNFNDNVKGNVAHNWALTAGLRIGF